ncbi:MAG: CsgG/HfaB family protein [Pseudomonadota bacterium]
MSALSSVLAGCGSIPKFDADRYVTPLSGAKVTANTTNYTEALSCLGDHLKDARLPPARFAVGRVEDYSGKQDLINGKRITQGTALMVISALSHTKLPIVERLDTSVAEIEFKYSDNKLIGGDSTNTPENPFRRTLAGSVVGSDYHIVGGVTEVNYNVRSGSIEGTAGSVGTSARYAVLDVAIDLRLINTRTLQVVEVASFQKQIIGTEVRAGIFRFLSDSVIDFSAADKAQEPIQKAVRMVTEHAVYHLVAGVYRLPASICEGGKAKSAGIASALTPAAAPAANQPVANQPAVSLPAANSPEIVLPSMTSPVSGTGRTEQPALRVASSATLQRNVAQASTVTLKLSPGLLQPLEKPAFAVLESR